MTRALLLAGLLIVAGCDASDTSLRPLRLAGTYTLEIDGYGSFEDEIEGVYYPEGFEIEGLDIWRPDQLPSARGSFFGLYLSTNTLAPGSYGLARNRITVSSDGGTCENSADFEPGAVSVYFVVYTDGIARCAPAVVTGSFELLAVDEADVRARFAFRAVPYGSSDTLMVRGTYALRSTSAELPEGRSNLRQHRTLTRR